MKNEKIWFIRPFHVVCFANKPKGELALPFMRQEYLCGDDKTLDSSKLNVKCFYV